MKVKLTMEFDIDTSDIDSKGDEEWAVFNAVSRHIGNSSNADDFYGTPGMKVDYTT